MKQFVAKMREWLKIETESDIDIAQLERNLKLTPDDRLREHQSALDLATELASAGQRLHGQSLKKD